MKVSELIEQLVKFPKDLEVYVEVCAGESSGGGAGIVREVELNKNKIDNEVWISAVDDYS